jgi:hypothetical protein
VREAAWCQFGLVLDPGWILQDGAPLKPAGLVTVDRWGLTTIRVRDGLGLMGAGEGLKVPPNLEDGTLAGTNPTRSPALLDCEESKDESASEPEGVEAAVGKRRLTLLSESSGEAPGRVEPVGRRAARDHRRSLSRPGGNTVRLHGLDRASRTTPPWRGKSTKGVPGEENLVQFLHKQTARIPEKSHGSQCLPTRGDEDPPPAHHHRRVAPAGGNTTTRQPEPSGDRAHYFVYDGRGSRRRHLFTFMGTGLQSVGQLLTKVRGMLGQEGAGVELQVGRTRHCSPDRQALPKGDHMDVTVWAPSLMGGGGHGESHRQKQKLGRNPPQTKVSGGRRAKARM